MSTGDARHGTYHKNHIRDDPCRGQRNKDADIAGAADADRRSGDDRGMHHEHSHDEARPSASERGLNIGRLARRDRHSRPQLGKGGRANAHDDSSREKRKRPMHAALSGGSADQDIDSGPDGDTQTIENRMGKRERPDEFCVTLAPMVISGIAQPSWLSANSNRYYDENRPIRLARWHLVQ